MGVVTVTGLQTMALGDTPETENDNSNNNNTDGNDGNDDEKYTKPPTLVAHGVYVGWVDSL